MRQIADFHIHSKYSRACSRDLTLANIDKTCRVKGIDLIGTGDFTYPAWFTSIQDELADISSNKNSKGLYRLRNAEDEKVKFILTSEVALIYKKLNKCRRVHMVIHAPNIEAVAELNKRLDKDFNIRSDGRPILGMSIERLCEICFAIHPKFLIYPAHIWTPWFAVFGSKSGFDRWEDAFGEYADRIYAYETGLSSDAEMNWRVSALDKFTLLSNSDAHSLPNLGREANVFNLARIDYDEIYDVIKNHFNHRDAIHRVSDVGDAVSHDSNSENVNCRNPHVDASKGANRAIDVRDAMNRVSTADVAQKSYLDYTIEFHPEEGMYHFDGHRDCNFSCNGDETKRLKGICPKCKKPLILGVDYRVTELANRPLGFKPEGKSGFKKLVELDKIIAESLGVKNRASKKVQIEYSKITKELGAELDILIDAPIENIRAVAGEMIALGIERMRKGDLTVKPGFDGQYGEVRIFKEEEKAGQKKLL